MLSLFNYLFEYYNPLQDYLVTHRYYEVRVLSTHIICAAPTQPVASQIPLVEVEAAVPTVIVQVTIQSCIPWTSLIL